jgi:hypothetical protein
MIPSLVYGMDPPLDGKNNYAWVLASNIFNFDRMFGDNTPTMIAIVFMNVKIVMQLPLFVKNSTFSLTRRPGRRATRSPSSAA